MEEEFGDIDAGCRCNKPPPREPFTAIERLEKRQDDSVRRHERIERRLRELERIFAGHVHATGSKPLIHADAVIL
jgi:hypothetical protein